jgi:hypothetical protein
LWFDKALLSGVEGLTTNGIKHLPFVLSLSKEACRRKLFEGSLSKPVLSEAEGDLFSVSLTVRISGKPVIVEQGGSW